MIGTIHCEAEWDRQDQVGETKWLEKLLKNNKFPNAIVCHAWFHKNNAEAVIAEQASFDIVKGIRSKPSVKFSRKTKQYITDGSMKDEKWRSGLKLLEKYNLNYDGTRALDGGDGAFRAGIKDGGKAKNLRCYITKENSGDWEFNS